MVDDWSDDWARRSRAAKIDITVPNVARVWNCLVGGRDNFDADRRAARQLTAAAPVMGILPKVARAFQYRLIRYLAAEAGIRQFLDIGTGMPTAGNTHDVAQAFVPESRIVYVDNDPVVISHARALLTSTPEGATSYIDADARDTARIIAAAGECLDFARPVALIMMGVLGFIDSASEAHAVVAKLTDAVVPGSYVAIHHAASDLDPRLPAAEQLWNRSGARLRITLRSRQQVADLVSGLDTVEPGLVPIERWRPELAAAAPDGDGATAPGAAVPGPAGAAAVIPLYGVVARKP